MDVQFHKRTLAVVFILSILTAPTLSAQERRGPTPSAARDPTEIIYPGAMSSGKARGPIPGMASVSYTVRERYPSTGVLHFYDQELAKLGYSPYTEPQLRESDRKWTEFIDSTIPGEPLVRQLGAHWTDPARKKRVLLVLRHYAFKDSAGKYRETEGQEVILQAYDFFEIPKSP